MKGDFRDDGAFLCSNIEHEEEVMPQSAAEEAQTGHKEMSLEGQCCGGTSHPEGDWISPRLCVSRNSQGGQRGISKGRKMVR